MPTFDQMPLQLIVRRGLGAAANLSGEDISINRQVNEVYFWVTPETRSWRQLRGSEAPSLNHRQELNLKRSRSQPQDRRVAYDQS